MGKIKKILENELVGSTQTTDVYPVTSIKAVYDENNERLDGIINRRGVVNISTNYNSKHIAEVLTLSQALSKVPSAGRVLGFQGKYLASDGWHTIIYTGDNLTDWSDKTKWIDLVDKIFNSISNNATFAGIATPKTNPSTPDGPVFYIANGKGKYEKFSGINVTEDEVVILYYDSSWHNVATVIASQEKLSELVENDAVQERIINGLKDQVNNYKPIEIFGNVTNAADEEDITSENGLLKFKNRSSLNGMGYVILRKDKTFAEQVTRVNTIYEIRYDFDLGDNQTPFEIPNNVQLRFIGGKLKNGKIKGVNTCIDSPRSTIFDQVIISGKFANETLMPEWFGAKGDGVTDDTLSLQVCIDTAQAIKCLSVSLRSADYLISSPLTASRIKLMGNAEKYGKYGSTIKASDGFQPVTIDGVKYNTMLVVNQPSDLSDIRFYGNHNCNILQYSGWAGGSVKRCGFENFIIGIILKSAEVVTFEDNFLDFGDIGVRIENRIFNPDIEIHRPQTTQPLSGSPNMIYFVRNMIQGCNIGIYANGGSNINCIQNQTAHNQMFGILAFNVTHFVVRDGYSEGDGACVKNVYEEGRVSGTQPAVNTSQVLIDSNLDGYDIRGTMYHAPFCFVSCNHVELDNNYISYKKRGQIANFSEFDYTRTNAGVDALILSVASRYVEIHHNSFYNWNIHIAGTGVFSSACTIYGLVLGDTSSELYIHNYKIDPFISYPAKIPGEFTGRHNIEDCVSVDFGLKGTSLNEKLRFPENNYSATLQGNPTQYSKANGKFFHELTVEYQESVNGIPLYRYSTASAIYCNIILADLNLKPGSAIEVCRFIKRLSHSGGYPFMRVNSYSTSGNNIKSISNGANDFTQDKQVGDLWLQRVVLTEMGQLENLRNFVVGSGFYPNDIASAQNFLFSPLFVREFGNTDVPDFSKYRLDRYFGTTVQRPTLGSDMAGFEYYDSTLKKKILWDGSTWVNIDGTSLA